MNKDLAQAAIDAALSGDWESAVKINLQILKKDPSNVDSLNRLSRAYAELGRLQKAKQVVQKTLKIDPFNSIALKAAEKYKILKKNESNVSHSLNPQLFLEEPGKTKIVNLLHLGPPKALAKLDAGDEVKLHTSPHRVTVTNFNGEYLGKLPDNLGARIRYLVKMGNEFKSFIKSVDKKEVKVFIREIKKAPSLSNVPSFPTDKIDYISFTPPELVHRKEEIDIEESVEE